MRRSVIYFLIAAAIAGSFLAAVTHGGSITSVSSSVSNSARDTDVTVTRRGSGDTATYSITICKRGTCNELKNSHGNYLVKIGEAKVKFERVVGGWGYSVKKPSSSAFGGHQSVEWDEQERNGEEGAELWCCMSTSPLSKHDLGGEPAESEEDHATGETKYKVTFGIESGNTTTGDGTLTWTESGD